MKKHFFLCALSALFLAASAHAQTIVQTGGSIFTGKDAAGVITDALIKAGAGENLQVSINQARDSDIITQASGVISADADSLTFDKAHSQWEALLLLKDDGKNLAPIKISGHYDEMAAVPVLKRRLAAGEIISANDLDVDKEPLSHLRPGTVTDAQDLIGKSPRHMLSQGRPIRTDEVGGAALVNKGTRVTLTFRSGNIEINTIGEAMEQGAKGDVIKVRNVTSKHIVEGTVETSDRVRVHAADTDSAEAM